MHLSEFLLELFSTGVVQVPGELVTLEQPDLDAAVAILQQTHARDMLDMPGVAPAFEPAAALWAACYLFRATQLVFRRDLGEAVIAQHLPPYHNTQPAPSAIYSADLCLRQLAGLLQLAKGLAPDDPLVNHIKETLRIWPFSGALAGWTGEVELSIILNDGSLRISFVDRIIESRQVKLAEMEPIRSLVNETLGDYREKLWPGLTLSI